LGCYSYLHAALSPNFLYLKKILVFHIRKA
jgi:hypothetical protein